MAKYDGAQGNIRVLSVQHYPNFGGPHNEILKIEKALNHLKVQTIVATTNAPGDAAPRLERQVELYKIPLSRFHATKNPLVHLRTLWLLIRDVATIRKLIRDNHIDVVKVHGPHNPQGAIAAQLEGVPVTWVLSSSTILSPLARRVGMTYVSRMAESLLVNGPSLLSFYPHKEMLLSRVHVFYPPVDTQKFRPMEELDKARAKDALGIHPDRPIVGTVANIYPIKGIDLFIRMAARVQRKRPDTQFMIVGGVPDAHRSYYQRVLKKARELGLDEQKVRFVGSRDDVYNILPLWDVKVISSRSEGTTATAGEALASGVPVVAFDVGAVSDIVENESSGILVPAYDTQEMARSVVALLQDPQKRLTMGITGRNSVIGKISIERCAETHRDAYLAALTAHAARQ